MKDLPPDTPETNAAVICLHSKAWKPFGGIVVSDVCRRFERERNSLQDQRDFCMGEIERLRKERDEAREALKDANESVVTFCALWAAQYAAEHGLPNGHLHPTHYDILQKAGARMNDFTRVDLQENPK